jgi:hypothetical protein
MVCGGKPTTPAVCAQRHRGRTSHFQGQGHRAQAHGGALAAQSAEGLREFGQAIFNRGDRGLGAQLQRIDGVGIAVDGGPGRSNAGVHPVVGQGAVDGADFRPGVGVDVLLACAAKARASATAFKVDRAPSSLPATWTVVQGCGARFRAALNAWWMASWAVRTRTGPACWRWTSQVCFQSAVDGAGATVGRLNGSSFSGNVAVHNSANCVT